MERGAVKRPFASSMDHLLAHLERIDLHIRFQVSAARATDARDPAFRGLCITEDEIEALLAKPLGAPTWAAQHATSRDEMVSSVERLRQELAEREENSPSQGDTLRLVELWRRLELSELDVDVVLLCLAPELDLRYERLYAYLQDDIAKKRPTIDLALSLLCGSFEERLAGRRRFLPSAPLVDHGLVHVGEESSEAAPHSLGRSLRLDPSIVGYLLDSRDSAALSPELTTRVRVETGIEKLVATADVKGHLETLCQRIDSGRERPLVLLVGPDTTAKEAVAKAVCYELGVPLLAVDGRSWRAGDAAELRSRLAVAAREARLQGAAVYYQFSNERSSTESGEAEALVQAVASTNRSCGLAFLDIRRPLSPRARAGLHGLVEIDLPLPGYDERVELWTRAIEDVAPMGEEEIAALAGSFRLSAGQIHAAVKTAVHRISWREAEAAAVRIEDLQAACRLHSDHGLGQLAQKIEPHRTWDDVVLPAERLAHLREIRDAIQHRALVYKRWGFGRKLSLGKGINVLFSGPSGTGKTMVAEVIAHDLGVDLYKIDLSCVVSKYIGETEKNLARVFDEAQTSNALLLFDEADALFGKRSAVRDAHDRYANIETGYLLQKMEEYDGVVILATNLRNNLDDAFLRRMAFSVAFPIPDEASRLRIWQAIWPPETPRANDLDVEFLARQFKLTGGNIKNIGVSAAFLAASNGRRVAMSHLVRATRRELQKIGKACTKAEFGRYSDLLEGSAP